MHKTWIWCEEWRQCKEVKSTRVPIKTATPSCVHHTCFVRKIKYAQNERSSHKIQNSISLSCSLSLSLSLSTSFSLPYAHKHEADCMRAHWKIIQLFRFHCSLSSVNGSNSDGANCFAPKKKICDKQMEKSYDWYWGHLFFENLITIYIQLCFFAPPTWNWIQLPRVDVEYQFQR